MVQSTTPKTVADVDREWAEKHPREVRSVPATSNSVRAGKTLILTTNQGLLDRASAVLKNCRDCRCEECISIRNDLITCLSEALAASNGGEKWLRSQTTL